MLSRSLSLSLLFAAGNEQGITRPPPRTCLLAALGPGPPHEMTLSLAGRVKMRRSARVFGCFDTSRQDVSWHDLKAPRPKNLLPNAQSPHQCPAPQSLPCLHLPACVCVACKIKQYDTLQVAAIRHYAFVQLTLYSARNFLLRIGRSRE